jgi:hypothetical protein
MPAPGDDLHARVEAGTAKAVAYLLSRQRDTIRVVHPGGKAEDVAGEWKDVVVGRGAGNIKIKGRLYENVVAVFPPGWFENEMPGRAGGAAAPAVVHVQPTHECGINALVTLALLSAGVNPLKEPKMARAIESVLHTWCADAANPRGGLMPGAGGFSYSVGIRASALEAATAHYRTGAMGDLLKRALAAEVKLLEAGIVRNGGYTYNLPPRGNWWDMSCTQYGILGLWAGHRGQIEIPDRVWQHFNNLLLESQVPDGGWPYSVPRGAPGPMASTPTMTAAGLASLFVMMDTVHTRGRGASRPDVSPLRNTPFTFRTMLAIEKGLETFARSYQPTLDGYYMYGVERIGVASGMKYFNGKDWFREGAAVLLDGQDRGGSWGLDPRPVGAGGGLGFHGGGVLCATSWNLMFLVFGNAPVLINKLQYGPKDDWQWNNYPRDAANLARWHTRSYESLVNWQILDVAAATDEDFLDAPVLYVGGYNDFKLADAQADKLRRYVQNGGTLLFVACGGKRPFLDAVLRLGRQMFPPERYPEFQFTALPTDHGLYSAIGAGEKDPVRKLPIWHMSDGRRSFAFAVAEDVNHCWQGNAFVRRKEAFELVAGIRSYATDRALSLPAKTRPPITADEPKFAGPARPAIKLGVVRFASKGTVMIQPVPGGKDPPAATPASADWDTAPAAWRVYREWFRHVAGADIAETRGVSLAEGDLKGFDVLHLTGSHAFELSAPEKAALKAFVAGGGFVLIDSPAGFKGRFHRAAMELLKELFPDDVKGLPDGHPLLTGKDGALREIADPGLSRSVRLFEPQVRGPADAVSLVILAGRPAVMISPLDLSGAIAGQGYWDRVGFSTRTARHLVGNWLALVLKAKEPPPPPPPAAPPAPAKTEETKK